MSPEFNSGHYCLPFGLITFSLSVKIFYKKNVPISVLVISQIAKFLVHALCQSMCFTHKYSCIWSIYFLRNYFLKMPPN